MPMIKPKKRPPDARQSVYSAVNVTVTEALMISLGYCQKQKVPYSHRKHIDR